MASRVPNKHWAKRWLVQPIETAAVHGLFKIFGGMSVDRASAIGGFIGRSIGPHLSVSRRARRNLRRIFPDMPAKRIEEIVRGMWDNLGRVAAEYPHLDRMDERVALVGEEHLRAALARGKPIIFFAGHLANWEITPSIAAKRGAPINLIYRAANNPSVDALVRRSRGDAAAAGLIPKGAEGARIAMRKLSRGEHLGVLADQKLNSGIPIPFFGRDAMTTSAIALLALRFDCTVLPAQIERLDGARFRLTLHPPLDLPRTADHTADVRAITTRVNQLIEGWIRQRPEQWLWLHNRWPD
jgi:KDO2-lipid IV(A) lauroyltransferase